jgi:CheY-like chemotaxis protein
MVDLAERAAVAIDNAAQYEHVAHERAQLEAVNQTKDEFLATLSHELRTPLNAILGWLQLLRGGLDPATSQRALETVERNARNQAELISELLDVSRIAAGKLHLESRRVDLCALVENAIDAIRPSLAGKGLTLDAKLELPGGVDGDADRLSQIVSNLLSNAVKFTPRGGAIDVELRRADDRVRLRVTDTGEGIRPEFLPSVFDRFRQAHSGATRTHGGLGLGLSIVKQLVEMHGGTVRAESAGEGLGATFVVDLPPPPPDDAAAPPEPPEQPVVPATTATDAALGGVRILVVDDDTDGRELVEIALARRGATVIAASSAAEALHAFVAHRPDVVISDVGLPEQDGLSLMREIRARASDGSRRTPAIALTAYASTRDQARAIEAGFDAHLAKPAELSELSALVARLVRSANP